MTKRDWMIFICTLLCIALIGLTLYAKAQGAPDNAAAPEETARDEDAPTVTTLDEVRRDAILSVADVDKPASEPQESEEAENEQIEAALLARAHRIDDCLITYYCCEAYPHICGTGDGRTASGRLVAAGVSCAVPGYIPLGSTVLIDWGEGELEYRVADDRGGWINGRHIDLAVAAHAEAMELGVRTATVYWCEEW